MAKNSTRLTPEATPSPRRSASAAAGKRPEAQSQRNKDPQNRVLLLKFASA